MGKKYTKKLEYMSYKVFSYRFYSFVPININCVGRVLEPVGRFKRGLFTLCGYLVINISLHGANTIFQELSTQPRV